MESKLTLALGSMATRLKFDCSEVARSLISSKIEAIEAAITLNEAPDLESALQSHLNQANCVVETLGNAFQLVLSILERVDQKKTGGPDKENSNGRFHQGNGTGGPTGSGNQGGGACYLCGSKFHWVRQCPERRT